MSYDVAPFYGFTIFLKNRLDAPLKPIMGILSERNAPGITLNDIPLYQTLARASTT